MSRTTVIARGRAAAEAGMVDTCTIQRSTGSSTDPFSGEEVFTSDVVYTGRCRIQQAIPQADARDSGQAYVLLQQVVVQLPIGVFVEVGDTVTITAATRDPDLVNRVFLVRDLVHKTDATARRVLALERTS